MMRLAFLLLFLPTFCYGQERLTLSKSPSPEQIQSAKDVIKSAATTPTALQFGGYALIDIKLEGKLTSYVVPGSDDCIKTITIPKGVGYEGWLVSKDSSTFVWTKIEPVAWDRVLVTGLKQGTATLIWMGVTNGEAVVVAAFQFVVGTPPPAPTPTPTPTPTPEPTPAPIPGAGFRVLMVTETRDLSTLPSGQVQAMTAKEVRDYLDSHTVKVDNQPEYRIFDKDIDLTNASSVWQEAMNRVLNKDQKHPESKYKSLPWILVTNGKTGYEGPLPTTTADMMKLLKQYGGN